MLRHNYTNFSLFGYSESVFILNFTDELNLTQLQRACLMNNSDKVAKLLRDKTVDICATDENKSTALHCVCQAGYTEIVELLIKERANRLTSALHESDADTKIKSFFNLTDNHEVRDMIVIACSCYYHYYY